MHCSDSTVPPGSALSDTITRDRRGEQSSGKFRIEIIDRWYGWQASDLRQCGKRRRHAQVSLLNEHDLAEPRRDVRPGIVVLRVGPDAHAAVRRHAVPAIEVDLPHGTGDGRPTRELLEIRPGDH